ncbi:MAG TPA: hypothetical protein PK264_01810 [Hyphomicrobiaceae bacterium]|nr:hypothetical protein [Hyphomicrobiaceae bacterium]
MNPSETGNFIVGQNRAKQPGTNTPDFTGRIGIPGREHEFPVALWAGRDRHGKLYFSGRITPTPITDNVMAQLESLTDRPVHDATDMADAGPGLTLRPFQMVAFANKSKEPVDTDSKDEAATRAKRPDFWARVNPGDGSPVFQVGIWAGQDRYGRPILRGETSYPQPAKAAEKAPARRKADARDSR